MRLNELFALQKPVYMAHMYYGDPSEVFSLKAMKLLCEHGVDIIEFGIPFSDPNADGPVFQKACQRALQNGMTPIKAIHGIAQLRKTGMKQPLVVTSYYNPIFQMGVDTFVEKIMHAGANALIVPNVPYEESDELLQAGEKHGINIIFLIAPTTSEQRLKEIIKRAKGFLYIITETGVTGVRESISDSTVDLIRRVRKQTNLPLLGGFGISNKHQAKAVIAAGANGVITGSVIGKIYEKYLGNPEKSFPEMIKKIQEIRKGCNEAGKIQQLEVKEL